MERPIMLKNEDFSWEQTTFLGAFCHAAARIIAIDQSILPPFPYCNEGILFEDGTIVSHHWQTGETADEFYIGTPKQQEGA